MNILEDAPLGDDAHYFAVELKVTDEPEDALLRELWESAPDKGQFGVPHAAAICERDKTETSTLRASLQRFNEPPEDGWQWSVDALARHLLRELCGIELVGGLRYPPNREICPHGNPYATHDGNVQWLRGVCAPCVAKGEPELLDIELNIPEGLVDP